MHAPLFRGDSDEHTVRMYTPVQPCFWAACSRASRAFGSRRLPVNSMRTGAFASSAADAVVSMAPDFTIVKKARG